MSGTSCVSAREATCHDTAEGLQGRQHVMAQLGGLQGRQHVMAQMRVCKGGNMS